MADQQVPPAVALALTKGINTLRACKGGEVDHARINRAIAALKYARDLVDAMRAPGVLGQDGAKQG